MFTNSFAALILSTVSASGSSMTPARYLMFSMMLSPICDRMCSMYRLVLAFDFILDGRNDLSEVEPMRWIFENPMV